MIKNIRAGHPSYAGLGLDLFTDDDVEQIHLATLDVLEKTGVFFEGKNALEILDKAGCRVDYDKHRAYFPKYLVKEAIASTPDHFVLAARDPQNDYLAGGDRVGFCGVGVAVNAIDLDTGEKRPSTLADVKKAALLTDYLDNYSICFDMLVPRDVTPSINALYCYSTYARYNTKHILQTPISLRNAEYLIEMAAAVAGGEDELRRRNLVMGGCCPQSPLGYSKGAAESIIAYAGFGLPNHVCPMVMSGGTGPVTLAGTLVIHNAEVLAGAVLSQSIRCGNPVVYGGCTTAMDLRSAAATTGSPEHALFSAAAAKMAQFYGMPTMLAGTWTDSKVCDVQCGHEKTIGTVISAMAGVNLVFGGGGIESGLTVDFAQLVADNDIYGMTYQALRGIPVSAETMQLDLIDEVGPRGNYLTAEHTMEHMREVQAQPENIVRTTTASWEAGGCVNMLDNAREEAKRILATHTPAPLPDKTVQELDDIIARAEKE